MTPYDDDLAAIHDAGFIQLAEAAARALIDDLLRAGVREGRVVELGCGPGASSRLLVDAGFDVTGFDLSPAMVERARRRVPEGEFRVESFVTAKLPAAVAVGAFGEVLNYAFDPANDPAAQARLFRRVYEALPASGVFLFDLAGPERAPDSGVRQSFREGDGWAVLVEAEATPDRRTLTRRIVTFRRDGDRYRRSEEIHHHLLFDPAEVATALTAAGFVVTAAERYGEVEPPPGVTVFRAVC